MELALNVQSDLWHVIKLRLLSSQNHDSMISITVKFDKVRGAYC